MANGQDNLIPLNKRPKEVQREIQRKGNEASIRVKKEKASFKQAVKWLAESDLKITEGNLYDMYKQNGIDISNLTPTELAAIGLWFGAATGKSENFKILLGGNNELVDTTSTITPDVEIKVIEHKDLEKALYEDND